MVMIDGQSHGRRTQKSNMNRSRDCMTHPLITTYKTKKKKSTKHRMWRVLLVLAFARFGGFVADARENETAYGKILIEGGSFMMGDGTSTKGQIQGSLKPQTVSVESFYIDATTAPNEVFDKFVEKTKFVTDSERFKWSFVLQPHVTPEGLEKTENIIKDAPHWLAVPGADWKNPDGPGSTWKKNYPVVHISHNDAVAFCKDRGGRLPTEAEWEYAARGGLKEKLFPWGDGPMTLPGDGRLKKWRLNVWQGKFPTTNDGEDGFSNVAPIDAFGPQNEYGLYNMIGNVWEWTDTEVLGEKNQRVLRGASFLDSVDGSFNHKVTINSRMTNSIDSASSNTGVRCAYDLEGKARAKRSEYVYPKPKPKMDQDTLNKVMEEEGVEGLQKYLGKHATVAPAGEVREKLEKKKEELKRRMKEEV